MLILDFAKMMQKQPLRWYLFFNANFQYFFIFLNFDLI